MAKIIVGLPAYNEESYIGTMVLRCREYATEVIVCDDGSLDKTAEVARLAGATVVSNGKNMGYGATIKHIIEEAKKREFDAFITIDADTQHNPTEINSVAQPVLEGYDMVIGTRNVKDMPRYRAVGGKVLSLFTNVLSKEKLKDSQSGFRAYSMKAVNKFDLKENGMSVSSEIIIQANKHDLRIAEVPISIRYTKDSSTLNPLIHGGDTLARILHMISRRKPLLFFGIGGITMVFVGVAFGIDAYNKLIANSILPIGTVLLSAVFLIVGVLSFFTGIILYALRRE